MSSIHFSNFQMDEGTDYFLYIGELKNYGLNHFLTEALARYYNRKFEFIAIVPDVLEQYNYDNLIVINPLVESSGGECLEKMTCRINANDFMAAVSKSRQIRSLIQQILRRQPNLYLYMYESLSEMTLDEIPGVSILGPDKHVAQKTNSKTFQLTQLADIVPTVEFQICNGYHDLIRTTDSLWQEWPDGIFVSKEYSAAGINSTVALCKEDIENKFLDQDVPYLISRFLPHSLDPTVLAVVANEDEIFIAGVADQRIENGNRFTGSTFPTTASPDQIRLLKAYTKKVGAWLARQGYQGIFGCDYIITHDDEIRFLEINARKQGTTLEFCCTLEQEIPLNAPNLPELEFYAVTEGGFPANTREIVSHSKALHWGTFNYKIHEPVTTQSYIPQEVEERTAFKKVADKKLKKDFLILEHIGSDFVIAQGSFIGRIVALGHDHESVAQGIRQGCKTIELTFTKHIPTETVNAG
ncbi:MAG: ATP-grasp domain-containing protein [Proteobacteria bacterium]|nr:ATP-grasp domain-containing protein [Desulfobacula sp.]MBU4132096.1 ATP-grasp domain-containing protein [Pseudomonadota bacterium]